MGVSGDLGELVIERLHLDSGLKELLDHDANEDVHHAVRSDLAPWGSGQIAGG